MQKTTFVPTTTFTLRSVAFRVPGRAAHPLSLTFSRGSRRTDLSVIMVPVNPAYLKCWAAISRLPKGDILLARQSAAGRLEQQGVCLKSLLPLRLSNCRRRKGHGRGARTGGDWPLSWHGALGRWRRGPGKSRRAIAAGRPKPLAHRLVDSLSGAASASAWIPCWSRRTADCLLLDEPTSALDIAHQVDDAGAGASLKRQRGLTVVAVLHDINMAARYCDYLVALRGGEMIAQGTPAGTDAQ